MDRTAANSQVFMRPGAEGCFEGRRLADGSILGAQRARENMYIYIYTHIHIQINKYVHNHIHRYSIDILGVFRDAVCKQAAASGQAHHDPYWSVVLFLVQYLGPFRGRVTNGGFQRSLVYLVYDLTLPPCRPSTALL